MMMKKNSVRRPQRSIRKRIRPSSRAPEKEKRPRPRNLSPWDPPVKNNLAVAWSGAVGAGSSGSVFFSVACHRSRTQAAMKRLGKMGPRTKSQDSGWSSYGWSSQDQWHHDWHDRPNWWHREECWDWDDSSRSVTEEADITSPGHSSSQDGPSDGAYSGDCPASDDEASADGCHPQGDGNFTRLEAHVADLRRDTFTLWPQSSWCKVQQRAENEYQAEIRLPPACAIRRQ